MSDLVDKVNRLLRLVACSRMDIEQRQEVAITLQELFFDRYRCPDKRCGYPFEPCAVGYCWSWANYVDDGIIKGKLFPQFCQNCELWNKEEE